MLAMLAMLAMLVWCWLYFIRGDVGKARVCLNIARQPQATAANGLVYVLYSDVTFCAMLRIANQDTDNAKIITYLTV
jgi:hypothetical protein